MIGKGLVYNSNACLIDSLLQCSCALSFIDPSILHDVASRQEACIACRKHMVRHPDESLRPRMRLNNNEIADVSDYEHGRAFLQSDLHSEPVIRFLMDYYRFIASIEPNGIKILVYTRFDCEAISPDSLAILFGRSTTDTSVSPHMIELFCNSGNQTTGFHYDPVFSNASKVVAQGAYSNESIPGCKNTKSSPTNKKRVVVKVEMEQSNPSTAPEDLNATNPSKELPTTSNVIKSEVKEEKTDEIEGL